MLWDKGEEIVNKAKDLMQGLKAKISFTMAQKKGQNDANAEEESKKGWSGAELSKWEQEEQEMLAQIEFDNMNPADKRTLALASPRVPPQKGILNQVLSKQANAFLEKMKTSVEEKKRDM